MSATNVNGLIYIKPNLRRKEENKMEQKFNLHKPPSYKISEMKGLFPNDNVDIEYATELFDYWCATYLTNETEIKPTN